MLNPMPPKTAVFTIVANNYTAQARVLLKSLRRVQPEWERFVLIADAPAARRTIPSELAHVVYARDLSLPNPSWFTVLYTVMEASTAVKPWMLEHLFGLGFERVVYLDPDIKLYSPMEDLDRAFESAELILTPHTTKPYPDSLVPNHLDIRKSGIYNLGFLGIKPSNATRDLLRWWQECCRENCRVAFDEHIFVDQGWMDFAPSFVPNTHILRHVGYNVAYWNLHYRSCNCSGFPAAAPTMHDGTTLRFFHFSGFDPSQARTLSRHQTRVTDGFWPSWLATLCDDYSANLAAEGYQRYRTIPWRFNPLTDLQLPEPIRLNIQKSPVLKGILQQQLSPERVRDIVIDFLTQPDSAYPQLPKYLADLYRSRADVRTAIPNQHPRFAQNVIAWFKRTGRSEFGINGQLPIEGWWNRRKRTHPKRVPHNSRWPKINVYGYFTSQLGLGESARSCARALRANGARFRAVNFTAGCSSPSVSSDVKTSLPFSDPMIDLIHVNSDQIPTFFSTHPEVLSRDSYRIAYWAWELDVPPPQIDEVIPAFDEIWCLSRWNRDCFMKSFRGPVRVVWPNVTADPLAGSRPTGQLPGLSFEGRCVFLALCDFFSSPERKNPAGAVEAYLRAFPEPVDQRLLVAKLSNTSARLDYLEQLERLRGDRPDIVFIKDVYSREQISALLGACTALVSLHASEGFGLPLAEALTLGKRVIATGYGGNTDFCTSKRAYLVRYRLRKIERTVGAYAAGARWAEADLDDAADCMRRIFKEWRKGGGKSSPSVDGRINKRSLAMYRSALAAATRRARSASRNISRTHGKRLKVVVFGAGSAGQRLVASLGSLYEVLAFADNDPKKVGQTLIGYPIVSPTAIKALMPDRILIASIYWKEIQSKLIGLGCKPGMLSVASL